jgi:hypothetical protein
MKAAINRLAESNTFFMEINNEMPPSKSKLYQQLHNMAYYFVNPQIQKPKQTSKPVHGNKGKTKGKGGKMLRLSPIKNANKKDADPTETEQSTIHKINH